MNPAEIYQRSRSDSLFAELTRRGLVAVFFDWFFAERPSREDLAGWFTARHIKTSEGGVHNLISRHGLGYRMGQAREASDSLTGLLPADTDARIKQAVKARTLDLVVSEMGSKEALMLERLERETAAEAARLRTRRQIAAVSARLKRQELTLSTRKFETHAADLALKFAKEIKTIAADRSLNADAKIDAVRQRLFGSAPGTTTEGQP